MTLSEVLEAFSKAVTWPALLQVNEGRWVLLWGNAPHYHRGEEASHPHTAVLEGLNRSLDFQYSDDGQTFSALMALRDEWEREGEV